MSQASKDFGKISEGDIYHEADIAGLTTAFAELTQRQYGGIQGINKRHAICDTLSKSLALVRHAERDVQDGGAADLGYDYVLALGNCSFQVQALIARFSTEASVISYRLECERSQLYAELSVVPAPAEAAFYVEGAARCSARCMIGNSAFVPGPIARQRCCGAEACLACLYRHNQLSSQNGRQFSAPCFQCGQLRPVFKRGLFVPQSAPTATSAATSTATAADAAAADGTEK